MRNWLRNNNILWQLFSFFFLFFVHYLLTQPSIPPHSLSLSHSISTTTRSLLHNNFSKLPSHQVRSVRSKKKEGREGRRDFFFSLMRCCARKKSKTKAVKTQNLLFIKLFSIAHSFIVVSILFPLFFFFFCLSLSFYEKMMAFYSKNGLRKFRTIVREGKDEWRCR